MKWSDLLGTLNSYFKIGLAGVRLKNDTGNLLVRNSADSADAEITTSKPNVSGDDIVINSDAAGSGNDWLLTLRRNAAQTAALILTPPVAKGTDGHFLRQKAGTGGTVLELELAAVGGSADKVAMEETTLAFGDSSPKTMFSLPASAIVEKIQVIIRTAFDGTPSASVGIAGTTSKYMPATAMDLTADAGTIFEWHPGIAATSDDLIITYSAGGAAAGEAQFLVYYAVPA